MVGRNATGVNPSSSSVVVGRARRKVMHSGAVRVMADGGKWKNPAGDEEDGRWKSGHGPSGQDPKRRKAEGGRLKEYTGVLLDREGSCQRGRQRGRHANQTPWQRVCDEGHGTDED